MCDSIKIPVSEVETNDLSEESGCKVNPADVTCHQIVDLNSEMQLEYSKKLPNFPDKNTNLNEFEPGFKESSNNISDELSKNKKPEDHNLSHYPKPVHKSDNEKKILGDQNNAKEILPKDFVHPHNEDNLLKDVDQHADEKEILQDVHNVEESLPKNVMVLGDKDILTKDVIDQHTEEKEILEDVHGVEGSLPENVMVLSDKDILPKDVIDQHDAENIDSKHLNLHDDNIPFSDVDQHNDTILPKSTEKQIDKAILSKDAIFDDDSCDFLPKDDVNQPNAVDNLCDVNDLNSQEPKQTQMTDEDSLSSDSRSPLKFETESSERFCKSRERSALPYFQLPKPDLEEFLIETDKKLHDNEIKSPNVQQEVETSKSQFSKDQFIVFEIGPLTPMDKFKNKFLNQTKQHTEPSPRVSPKTYQGLQINSLLLSKEMEEKDSPGFKRLVLKEYLKQKIDEKKVAAFNRFKEASKLDEEEEMYVESDDSGESLSDSESNEFRKRIEKMMAPKEAGDVLELEKEEELPENLEGACSDSEKLEIETEHLEPADDDSDDDILPNVISQNNKNVSNDHNSFHTDSEESEDEIMFTKKSKQCKRLVDDSDEESDLNNVSYGHSQIENKTKVIEKLAGMSEENSLDSVDAAVNERNDECDSVSSVSSSNQDVSLEANNAFQKSFQKNSKDYFTATPEISSSAIPSYQPGGGFQDEESNSSLDSISCRSKGIVSKKCLKTGISDSFLSSQGSVENRSFSSSTQVDAIEMNNQFVGDHSLNKAPKFGVSLDDLPISQGDSDNIFASQDVDNICSGIFHDSVPPRSLLEESILKLKDPDTAVATEKVEDFLDAEAELSGEDDGLDDDSDEEGNEVNDIIAADDDLPSDEELRDGIADLFMKRINDDDDMLIKKVQEHFLDDGELNTDGAGRSRRFQWKNDDIENNDQNNMSESDNEEPDESWNALNREKAKWQLENVKQLTEDLTPEEFVKKPILRMKILGKPGNCTTHPQYSQVQSTNNLIDMNNALPMHQKRKRTRGSLFNLDDGSASQVLKRLKAAEDSTGGSRTTKHFVFRNDVVGSDVAETKEVAVAFTRQTSSTRVEVGELSVFDKI